MASAALSAPNFVRAAPVGRVGARRATRPVRGVVAVRAETGEKQIAGLTPCGKYQELCKAEIPTKIPRHDFLKQMYRYMVISFGDNGLASYGKRMDIDLVDGEDGLTNGMCVNMYGLKDGAEVLICELYCEMDTEMVPSYDTLMPSQDGEIIKSNRSGKDEFVKGRFFVIRRPVPIDESANPALKQMIKDMTLAINKYYAFGSCFSEDDT